LLLEGRLLFYWFLCQTRDTKRVLSIPQSLKYKQNITSNQIVNEPVDIRKLLYLVPPTLMMSVRFSAKYFRMGGAAISNNSLRRISASFFELTFPSPVKKTIKRLGTRNPIFIKHIKKVLPQSNVSFFELNTDM
jgi:hypothetical protein